jgi:hypothetical protein
MRTSRVTGMDLTLVGEVDTPTDERAMEARSMPEITA